MSVETEYLAALGDDQGLTAAIDSYKKGGKKALEAKTPWYKSRPVRLGIEYALIGGAAYFLYTRYRKEFPR